MGARISLEDWREVVDAFYWGDSAPSPEQAAVIEAFLGGRRRILICGGERAGKSRVAACCAVLGLRPDGEVKERRLWLVGGSYIDPRQEFIYIRNFLDALKLIERETMPQSIASPWILTTKHGWIVETKTSSDVSKLATFSVNGALMCEAGNQEEEVLYKLYGRLSETRGWLLVVGTLENSYSWYLRKLKQWRNPNNIEEGVSFSIPSWANRAVYPGGIDDPEIQLLKRSVPEDWFLARYAGEPAPPRDLVIPEFDPSIHVVNLSLEPSVPIELAVDPGKNAYAVLFIQRIGRTVHVVDAIYERGAIIDDVLEKVVRHPLYERINRNAGANVIDFAARQQHGMMSHWQLWQKRTGLTFATNYWKVNDTIDAVRYHLRKNEATGEPLLYFSSKLKEGIAPDGTAAQFLSEFYLWRWPPRREYHSERAEPVDANNHGIKALGYYLLHHFGLARQSAKPFTRKRERPKSLNVATIHEKSIPFVRKKRGVVFKREFL